MHGCICGIDMAVVVKLFTHNVSISIFAKVRAVERSSFALFIHMAKDRFQALLQELAATHVDEVETLRHENAQLKEDMLRLKREQSQGSQHASSSAAHCPYVIMRSTGHLFVNLGKWVS
jgi:cell shape-determining protein MreC